MQYQAGEPSKDARAARDGAVAGVAVAVVELAFHLRHLVGCLETKTRNRGDARIRATQLQELHPVEQRGVGLRPSGRPVALVEEVRRAVTRQHLVEAVETGKHLAGQCLGIIVRIELRQAAQPADSCRAWPARARGNHHAAYPA